MACMVVCCSCQPHKDLILREYSPTPLLPEQACFVHPDSSLRLCQKSEVHNKYSKKTVTSTVEPTTVDVFIVDSMFRVRRMLPEKYPNSAVFARLLLMKRSYKEVIYIERSYHP